jgi:hypothetical protein
VKVAAMKLVHDDGDVAYVQVLVGVLQALQLAAKGSVDMRIAASKLIVIACLPGRPTTSWPT